jgi:hypothetical protein
VKSAEGIKPRNHTIEIESRKAICTILISRDRVALHPRQTLLYIIPSLVFTPMPSVTNFSF